MHGPLFNAVVDTVSTLTWRGFTPSSSEVMLHGIKARKVDSDSMDCENDPSTSCERGKVVQISKF